MASTFIKFSTDVAQLKALKQGFSGWAGKPNNIGAIERSHFPIETPSVAGEHTFVNRKKKHSINIQAICDHNLLIRHLVVQWPGVPTTTWFGVYQVCIKFLKGEQWWLLAVRYEDLQNLVFVYIKDICINHNFYFIILLRCKSNLQFLVNAFKLYVYNWSFRFDSE